MSTDHASRLRTCAEIIVRIGLNLQPGQRLLLAEPYELQGVSREASALVEAISAAALAASGVPPIIIWGDPERLRQFAEQADWRGFTQLVAANADHMKHHLAEGGAFLFPLSSTPQLMQGVAAERVSELQRISWTHFGPIIQRLTHGESQWLIVPAPTPAWADAAFADLPAEQRLEALQETVLAAMRVLIACNQSALVPSRDKPAPTTEPIQAWHTHFAALERQRDALNSRRHKTIRYQGPGTDLTVKLPAKHQWCTAQLSTKRGVPFVANLPTEEVFTAPDRNSAEGIIRVSRPLSYGGSVIEGIELAFKRGRVVQAQARTGRDLLQRLLDTDDGSARLGEVALIVKRDPAPGSWQNSGRLFYHTLLDENASPHIALGESYHFCNRSLFAFGLNRSLVHVDLPLDATVELL